MDWAGGIQNIYVYAYSYLHAITINEKDDMDLKESGKDYIGGWEGGKRREKCNYIIISKIIWLF